MNLKVEGELDGQTNMDVDRALLARAEVGESGARIYFWDRVTVSLGRFQLAEGIVLGNLPFVERPTGGAAVLHGHDLTYSIALPLARLGVTSRQVREIYRAMVRPLVFAFQELGISAALGEDVPASAERARSDYCFAMHSRNDVINPDTGVKLCGCAMRVTESAALLQVSVPIKPPVLHPNVCISGGEEPTWIDCELGQLILAIQDKIQKT